MIELFSHNQRAYNRICQLWKVGNRACAIQPTGTGKSYIIAKILRDFVAIKKIVVAPSYYIIEQQRALTPTLDLTIYMTYAKLSRLSKNDIAALGVELIILDEFHRAGAKEWGRGVQRLLDAYPKAKVLGTSATPIRHLDQGRNMGDELFEGSVAVDMSLVDAIVDEILPCPRYVSALYSIEEEAQKLKEEVEESKKNPSEKEELLGRIEVARVSWQKTFGMPEIIKRHLSLVGVGKIIIFCESKFHMFQIKPEVVRWFRESDIYSGIETYEIFSGNNRKNSHDLRRFQNAKAKDHVNLLFAIDMFNEGLHIDGVGAVLLLRQTKSPIIFYQQIGRCIKVSNKRPIIFDLVNNFQNVQAKTFLEDLDRVRRERGEREDSEDPQERDYPVFHIHDETRDIVELFGGMREQLVSWEVYYRHLLDFVAKNGNARVPNDFTTEDGIKLGSWVDRNRTTKKNGELSEQRIQALERLKGWLWNPKDSTWQEGYAHLVEFINENGHPNVPDYFVAIDGHKLGRWVSKNRVRKRNSKLSDERIKTLEGLQGWSWNPHDELWQEGYAHLVEFVKRKKHARVPYDFVAEDGFRLGKWVDANRVRKRNSKLSDERIKTLEGLQGWSWNPYNEAWQNGYNHLLEFVEQEKHARVPLGFITIDSYKLGRWVDRNRQKKKADKLSLQQIQVLERLAGWSW